MFGCCVENVVSMFGRMFVVIDGKVVIVMCFVWVVV